MIAQFESICKAEANFREVLGFLSKAIKSEKLRIDEVERELFSRLLGVGHSMLEAFIAAARDGDHGETVHQDGKTLHRSETKKRKMYRSIFGVLAVDRFVYTSGAKKKVEWAPVDAKLGLPIGEQSYVLEDWLQRVCVKESFQEGVGSLRDLLGVKTSVRAAEVVSRNMAEHAESFSESTAALAVGKEEELIVLAADGKGVPMRRPLEQRLKEYEAASQRTEPLPVHEPRDAAEIPASTSKRLKKGEKRTRKQMAYVGAVYSIATFVRTAQQIVDELRRKEAHVKRPRPQNKQLFAEMTRFREDKVINGQVRCFAHLAQQAISRAGVTKTLICLMDGQRSLWNLKDNWFPRAIGILDIFHVMERLWQVAHAFHGEGTRAAENQVDRHLFLLLEGKVSNVIGLYKRMLREQKLKGGKATTVRAAITYFENNKQYMKYDEYLAHGYPIGTGVVEGACRHLVKDRMEMAGMRWDIEGAQAILWLRAFYLNDQWDAFVEHRIQVEQEELYGLAA